MDPTERLSELLAPLDLRTFFADYYQKKPIILRGSPERSRGIVSLAQVVSAIASDAVPQGKLLIDRDNLRADAVPSAPFAANIPGGISPGTEPLWAYVEEGRSILWNAARGASSALDRVCHELAQALGASVWPNVYATGTAATPFEMHFDCHEVLALQCDGAKEWRISGVRVDHPLDLPSFRPIVERTLEGRRAEALAETAILETVEPGDVVYIPRGQFHNARAIGGRSLHVTFGIQHLTGLDVVEVLLHLATSERLFREYVPATAIDDERALLRSQLTHLGARLAELASTQACAETCEALVAKLVTESGPATAGA